MIMNVISEFSCVFIRFPCPRSRLDPAAKPGITTTTTFSCRTKSSKVNSRDACLRARLSRTLCICHADYSRADAVIAKFALGVWGAYNG